MNRNDIRPAVIGIAAGAATIAGLMAWLEFEPDRAIVNFLARRQLTAAERAELARIDAKRIVEQADRASFYKEQEAEQAVRRAELLAGFDPELLSVAWAVQGPDDLDLDELVAEIVHVEAQYRSDNMWILDSRAAGHGAALREEWRRRTSGLLPYTRSKVEQLRYELARTKVEAATTAPYPPLPPFTPIEAYTPFDSDAIDETEPNWEPDDSTTCPACTADAFRTKEPTEREYQCAVCREVFVLETEARP